MTQKLILFAENGDSVAETPGTLWDLLANAGGIDAAFDPQAMTVAFMESTGPTRVLPLGAALKQTMDEGEQERVVKALKDRAAGYTKLAKWLGDQSSAEPSAATE